MPVLARVSSLEVGFERVANVTDRITDLISDMRSVLAAANTRIEYVEKNNAENMAAMRGMREVTDARMENILTKVDKEIKETHAAIAKLEDTLSGMIEQQTRDQLDREKIKDKRIEKLEKMYWITAGACAVIGFFLARMNINVLF